MDGIDNADPGDLADADPVATELDKYRRVAAWDSWGNGSNRQPGAGAPSSCKPDMTRDPLAFWRANEVEFPILSRVARKYLAIPAASAAVERLFSYTGHRVSKRNANVSDEVLLNSLLVRASSKFVDRLGGCYLQNAEL